MRSFFVLTLSVLVCGGCGTVHEPPPAPAPPKLVLEGWKDVAGGRMGPDGLFYSEAGRFFAAFPGMPVHHGQDIQGAAGRLRMESYVYEESDVTAYMVAYTDYPVEYVQRIGWEDFLATAQAGAIRSLQLTGVPKEKPITINGHHGTRFRCDGNGQYLASQFLLVGNRLYQCTVLTQGYYAAESVIEQFFDRFHLETGTQEVVSPKEGWWPADLDTLARPIADSAKAG